MGEKRLLQRSLQQLYVCTYAAGYVDVRSRRELPIHLPSYLGMPAAPMPAPASASASVDRLFGAMQGWAQVVQRNAEAGPQATRCT